VLGLPWIHLLEVNEEPKGAVQDFELELMVLDLGWASTEP
jgi:hypothetical protein